MSALDLHAFQAGFAAALASGDPAARPEGLEATAAPRFRIHRNNFTRGLSEQLAEAYPAVRRLVGEEFFLATARVFLNAHAPHSRSLALFGEDFPDFLEGFPPAASLPYLADVARLERAWLEALHAADGPPLDPAALRKIGYSLAETRFVAHPAARIVRSVHPTVDLWRANQPDAEPGPRRIEAVGQSALITRPKLQVEVRQLSPARAAFVGGLFAGDDAIAASEQASQVDERFDVAPAFRELLSAGAFVGIGPLPDRPHTYNHRRRMT